VTTKRGYFGSVESENSALSANFRFTQVGSSLDIIQDRQSTYNVTMSLVCITNFEVEEQ
jgi:hypothetical protein